MPRSLLQLALFLLTAHSVALGKPAESTSRVTVTTTHGSFSIELYDKQAPLTVRQFLRYVEDRFYDSTIFHRVIPGFVVQAGGYTKNMEAKPANSPIANEASDEQKNLRGTVAMARGADANSATTQFFINLVDNAFLDKGPGTAGYTVFGKIIDNKKEAQGSQPTGFAVIEKIAREKTGNIGIHTYVPLRAVTITSIRAE